MSEEHGTIRVPNPGSRMGGGRFVLEKILGRGGMGLVWLARDEKLDKLVALKFISGAAAFDPASLAALRREVARAQQLTHPNILRVHDLHEQEGEAPFIVMEYVDGPTLTALRVKQPGGVLPWDTLAPLVRQLCDALDHAHGEHVIHRDLKPGNLMLDSKGRLKLADFGIAATYIENTTRLTGVVQPGISGTLPYMSPQQLQGAAPKPADDLYSLGATIYELLTGTPPFHQGELVHQILNQPPQTPSQRLTETRTANPIPPHVEQTILLCLDKDPAKRPQTAAEISERLRLPETRSRHPSARPGRRKSLLAAGAAVVALLIIAGFWRARVASPVADDPTVASAVSGQPAVARSANAASTNPPGKWTKVFTRFEDIPAPIRTLGILEWRDGWIDGTSTKGTPIVDIPSSNGQNQGIRAHGKLLHDLKLPVRCHEGLRGVGRTGTRRL